MELNGATKDTDESNIHSSEMSIDQALEILGLAAI